MTPALQITMPRLSDSMEEGTLVRWMKRNGETVEVGDELAEIEFDKATTIHEAETAGVLTTVINEGDTVAVGTVMAWLGQAAAAGGPDPSARAGRRRLKASPVARRMAAVHGVALESVPGSGPDGRITRTDVAQRIAGPEPVEVISAVAAPATPATPATSAGAHGEVTTQPLSRMQALIAKRMIESHTGVPNFEVRVRVDAEPIESVRRQLKAQAPATVPSINDFVVKAAALALREYPRANGAYRDDAWDTYGRVNVGIAVATEQGLIVPTIFDADTKSLMEIRAVARDLSARAREGRTSPSELEGATFTVTNLGMFGVDSFTAVITPRQAAILAVGAALPTPVVHDNAVVPGLEFELGLSCDHRILYGADAARVITRIRDLLEHPVALVMQ